MRHLVETVTALQERGVGFRSIQESIDTTTSGGRLVFHVFCALAEFERDLIRERAHAGLAAARARGQGRRPQAGVDAPEGRCGPPACTTSEEHTVAEIAKVLGVSRATIYRHLAVPAR
ncbi:MAG: recombinase family protein [Nocardioidaceae bacterium]